jgi:hypothetical protein
MVIDLAGVTEGMDVLDSAGDKIGTVRAVRTTMIGGSGFDTGGLTDADAGATPNTYVEIADGQTLWVPSNQIASVDGDGVHLECERSGCEDRYGLEPPGLS